MVTCCDCFLSFAVGLLEYHRFVEHGVAVPVGFVAPVSTGHVFVEQLVSIGDVVDAYGD